MVPVSVSRNLRCPAARRGTLAKGRAVSDAPTTVLLVEDEPADARLIQEALAGAGAGAFLVEWVEHLPDALERLGRGGVDVVLLDLTLLDGQGIEAFDQVVRAAPDALILVLSASNDEEAGRQAVQRGALDYLPKDHVDAHWLPRALRYVIERKAAQDALRGSEMRFRAMSDASPLGIFVSDAEGDCVYTNAAYQQDRGAVLRAGAGHELEQRDPPGGSPARPCRVARHDRASRGAVPVGGAFSARTTAASCGRA